MSPSLNNIFFLAEWVERYNKLHKMKTETRPNITNDVIKNIKKIRRKIKRTRDIFALWNLFIWYVCNC